MKAGIIGFPQTGKKTLFQILTGNQVPDQAGAVKPVPGAADILDNRFDRLVDMYDPKKQVRARLELVLLPRLEADAIAKGDIFRDIADMDAVCHVVRAFEDEAVYHAQGSVDPLRDIETVNAELLMHDQIFVEKRIERIESMIKKVKDDTQIKERALLEKLKDHLEAETPLRLIDLTADEEKLIRSYPFITRKQMVAAVNVSEADVNNRAVLEKVRQAVAGQNIAVMLTSAKVEAEIALLDSQEEKDEFLTDLGIQASSLEVLTRLFLDSLGLVSFFTVGKDEVRQWLLRQNSKAPAAAGVIHSDLARGFIRAEVMKYDELIAYGSEAELKKAGKMLVQGKEYTVEDGDILNIRFSV